MNNLILYKKIFGSEKIDKKYIDVIYNNDFVFDIDNYRFNINEINEYVDHMFYLNLFYKNNRFKYNDHAINDILLNYKKHEKVIKKLSYFYHISQLINIVNIYDKIFYNELYETYLINLAYIKKIKNSWLDFYLNKKIDTNWYIFDLKFLMVSWVYSDIKYCTKDSANWLSIDISLNWEQVFTTACYIWKDNIFLSNIEYKREYYKKFSERNTFFHRLGLIFSYSLALYFNKDIIIWPSDKEHCCRDDICFRWKYDDYFESFGFKRLNNDYYKYDILRNKCKEKYLKYIHYLEWYYFNWFDLH